MKIEPLSQSLFDKAVGLGIKKIILRFSGGSDEGYLDVETHGNDAPDLTQEIEDWAWGVYGYSGAGDGSSYGDNIEYDLENRLVNHAEWYQVEQTEDSEPIPLVLSE